ncbi:MAG TPA: 1-deoxy-D-xylulose-5-phosphate reductoisomerase [Smithellaceae bacterium]|nr:1-deoxy-D-xylulose-5-phosphate reductoisomerase [Smithellaceae bacterium]HQF84131.1 1-deoxy-D-xylulose-5-phosphate reductoisomerase [Smithellaceae bacterium]HQG80536.1 1-deoxy-D-xylulose-5-phosphate reductoisomerase [Smithellaceae bacterium]
MKKIGILGSTGSIGLGALDVVAKNPKKFKISALAAGSNIKELARQIALFRPSIAACATQQGARELNRLAGRSRTRIVWGEAGLEEAAATPASDIVLSAISGAAGLKPTLAAIEAGKDIALANKEVLVAAGQIVTKKAKKQKVMILPVDSEHSAIFQCLSGQKKNLLKRLVLTASGGPFYKLNSEALEKVTVAQALCHPRWRMGKKITVDSASLMNKGLEVIEARWLFDVDISRIDVLIHPQSVVHSLVEMIDGSVLAQLGIADMRIPIAYALSYPLRITNDLPPLDLSSEGSLVFHKPDLNRFPCLGLAFDAGRRGGTLPAVMNAANEIAVAAFLKGDIRFVDLPKVIAQVMSKLPVMENPSLTDILACDHEARQEAILAIIRMKKG